MMKATLKSIIPLLAGLLIAAAVYTLITQLFQSTVQRIIVVGKFPSDTQMVLSSMDEKGNQFWKENIQIKGDSTNKVQRVGTRVLNYPLKHLRIDFVKTKKTKQPGEAAGVEDSLEPIEKSPEFIEVSGVQVLMPYAKNLYYNHKAIINQFTSEQRQAEGSLKFVYPHDRNISIQAKQAVPANNEVLSIGVSLLFGLGIFLIARNSQWASLPAFSDMSLGNKISTSEEFNTINGMRGMAAILVLVSHTSPGFHSLQIGLALLFIISGFLLSKPFVINSKKIFSWSNIERYLTKRIKRILPMYYFYVFIMFGFSFQFATALRHFIFIQAKGHLWPMTQIFTFYMLLPVVLLITSAAYRINRWLPIFLLGLGCYYWIFYVKWMPYYNGEYSHPFFLYAFLMGVLSSYLFYDVIANSTVLTRFFDRWHAVIGVLALTLTVCAIAWSALDLHLTPAKVLPYISQFYIKCIVVCLMIILALVCRKGWFGKIMGNWLFRSVGVVGFSFYLLHGFGMDIVREFDKVYLHTGLFEGRSWYLTISAFIVTYILSLITYSFVERPFFGYHEKKSSS